MSRYIDADAVITAIAEFNKYEDELEYPYASDDLEEYKDDARLLIEDAPTIDIVRCNECEWLKVHNTKELYAECRKWHIRFYPFDEDTRTHGCSWGEREGE